MRKIIFSFIIAFIISLPYASAERLLDIGAELFYQRFMEYNNILKDTNLEFEDTKLNHYYNTHDMYIFSMRHEKDIIAVNITSNPDGYVNDVMILGTTVNGLKSLASITIVDYLVNKVIGITPTEANHLKNEVTFVDDDFWYSNVWVNSLNRPVTRSSRRHDNGIVGILYHSGYDW